MKLRTGIRFKITTLVLIVVILSVFAIGLTALYVNKGIVENRYKDTIQAVVELKSQKIESFFREISSNIQFGAKLKIVKEKVANTPFYINPNQNLSSQTDSTFLSTDPIDLLFQEEDSTKKSEQGFSNETLSGEDENLQSIFLDLLQTYGIYNVILTDSEQRIVFVEGPMRKKNVIGRNFNDFDKDGSTISIGRDSVYFSNIFYQRDTINLYVSAPIKNDQEETIGVLIYDINLDKVFNIVQDRSGLGETGYIQLTKSIINTILRLNPAPNETNAKFETNRTLINGQTQGKPLQLSAKGQSGLGFSTNHEGTEMLSAWQTVPLVDWGITVQITTEEVYSPIRTLSLYLLIAGGSIIFISFFLSLEFSRVLVKPLLMLQEFVNLLSKGILPSKLVKNTQDELGDMTDKLNELVENLKNTANFAIQIGKENFEADFHPASERDNLGIALLNMRDSIQVSAQKDDERSWIVTGLADIGDILPSISTIGELGELVSEYVTNKIGAIQGAFYTVNDDNENDIFLEMNASYAYHKKKYLQAKFRFAEGLIGQAAIEQDTILRTEIPNEYMTISSGILGDRKPKCLLITPLITNEKVYGVLEFAGFEQFGSREVEFVKEISELIARTVFNIKVKENTERLLRESQAMSSELQVKQEVLRQNAEEMEATQDQLQRTNQALENQVNEVQKANDRIRLLLENASEVITIYEADATIRYISPSVEKILGYTQDEMIGVKDIAYVHPSGVDTYEQMFKDLFEKPDERVKIEFSYFIKNGDRIWLEATGTNLLSDPAIQGIVLNTRDITERRAAEREQRLRGQMQALSENSPDLITRISKEGTVFYINPTIENYTGKNKENYLQKHLKELELSSEVLDSWADIIKEVLTKNQKINLDMDFPSIMGERVMQVNAIPEYNDHNNMESVLLVSHDITERKIIELEISQKSRKITESINYAKRIQEAILPNNGLMRQYLPQSFILYKPRDVVSGDFPWFLQKGDDIFIAAVDCTGHGVPGALISLIGFFLLNNIVNIHQADSPGEILDMLDEEVTRTLRQDESDASSKDGMDISLCKINKKKMQMEYAGAHRPLYYVSDDQLLEIKGNKFPIGGAQYKNRTHFTNTVINYKPDDAVFLFSDGFPDQFGGAKNKKFSPRRIRDIIQDNQDKDLDQMHKIMEEEFEKWRGNNKQTDDVLMIGIKL